MKHKILSLLTLLVVCVTGAWADQTWDFTEMSSADATAYSNATSDWVWNKNGYYGNKFTPNNGIWTDVISTTITQISGMKFMRSGSNMGESSIRVYKNSDGNKDGSLKYNNSNVAIGIQAQKDDVIKITYGNTNSSAQGYVLTNAKRKSDNATTITVSQNATTTDELIVTATGQVEFKCNNSKVILYKIVLESASSSPSLSVTPSTAESFSYIVGSGPSEAQSFTITGSNLSTIISATLSNTSDYEMRIGNSGEFSTSQLTPASGNTIQVRLKAGLSHGEHNGNLTFSSTGADSKVISLVGSVTNQTYSVAYDLNGASGDAPTETAKESDASFTLAAAPSRDCYAFAGWLCSADGDVKPAGSPYTMTATNTTFTAQWTPLYASGIYTFENNNSLGTSTNIITLSTDDKATAVAANSRVDNIFFSAMNITYEGGIYSGGGDDFKGWKIKTDNATIKFLVENNSTVTIGVGNLTSGMNITYTPTSGGATTVGLTAKTDNEYSVKGGTLVTLTTTGSSTVTLKKISIETPGAYTITKGSATNGSFSVSKTSADAGATITLSATPNTGYEFTSWSVIGDVSEGAVTVTNNQFTMPSESVTVNATFTAIDYDITHSASTNGTYTIQVGDADAVSGNTTANYNQTITLAATADANYALRAWNVTKTSGGASVDMATANTFVMPAEAVTISPEFDAVFPVSFNMQEHGSAIEAQNVINGGKVTEPTAPTADGYVFGGWYKEPACINAWNFSTDVVTEVTTLYAKWTEYVAPTAGVIFSLTFVTAENDITLNQNDVLDLTASYATIIGGAASIKHLNSTSGKALEKGKSTIYYNTNNMYLKLNLNDPLMTGDVITISDGEGNQIAIATTEGSPASQSSKVVTTMYTYTVTESDVLNGKAVLYLGRSTSGSTRHGAVTITRGEKLTIGPAGWASFSCARAIDFSGTEVTAYIAKEHDASSVTLSAISKVPAETGLVVNGTAGTYYIPLLSGDADATTGNLMKPNLEATELPAKTGDLYNYTLAYESDAPVFKHSTGEGALAAGKAYLQTSVNAAAAPSIIRIVDGESNATAIEDIQSADEVVKFIENGQLFIKKNGIVYDALGCVVR